jgi:leucyl aminopeptidase
VVCRAGTYNFSRYKTGKLDTAGSSSSSSSSKQAPDSAPAAAAEAKPLLVVPQGADRAAVSALAEAFFWARDMINTPAQDLSPQHLAAEAAALAAAHPGVRCMCAQSVSVRRLFAAWQSVACWRVCCADQHHVCQTPCWRM